MTAEITEPTTFSRTQTARGRNEVAYEVTVNCLNLPNVAYEATDTAVLAFAMDIGVLAEWLYEQGGEVTVHDLGTGVTVWTLHTSTVADPGQIAVSVLVSVPMVTGETVMHEIAAAVKA